jgi:D-alanyl-D-alanine carboxypeptidase/D-alanyl-D-alanine-endopeptidase (penicillin-binding protein 4)
MRQRVRNRGVAGNAHIKTGSLNDVRAIAGYVLAASGKRYAVVCIVNHRNAPAAQEAGDALLQWVYEHG